MARTADDVVALVHREINYQCNRIIGNVHTAETHPTYITKPIMRQHVGELKGMTMVARAVSEDGNLPDELADKVALALAKADEYLTTKR